MNKSKLSFQIQPGRVLSSFYILVTLFLLAFVNFDGATGFMLIIVPHIEYQPVPVHFLLVILISIIFLTTKLYHNQHLIFDIPTFCLILKCILDTFPVFREETEVGEYFWHWACTAVSLFSYFLIINSHFDASRLRKIKSYFVAFGLILSAQVIYTFLFMPYSYFDLRYKAAMVIPYGGTNIIASAIIPCFSLVLFSEKKIKDWFFIIVMSTSIILTKSRGGLLVYGILWVAYLYVWSSSKNYKTIRRLVITAALVIGVIELLSLSGVQKLLMGYMMGQYNVTLSQFSSGRFQIWGTLLHEILNGNYLFGVGMLSLTSNVAGAHNVIIDAFYKCGFIGGINFLLALCFLVSISLKKFKDLKCRYSVAVDICIINMLIEVNYFSYGCDAFFWILAGLMMREYYLYKKNMIYNQKILNEQK